MTGTDHAGRGRRGRFSFSSLAAVTAVLVLVSVPSGAGSASGRQPASGSGAAPSSPVDPLTAAEIGAAVKVIRSSPSYPVGAYFPLVVLHEPPKSEVLAWSPGQPFRREAFADVYDQPGNRLFEAIVDLHTNKVISWVQRPNTQPALFNTNYLQLDGIVRQDPNWQHAMAIRGIKPADVYLDGWSVGTDEIPANVAPGTRLLRELSFWRGNLPNPYDRPIEGVVVTVDMNRLKVVEVVDTGVRPVNTTTSGSSPTTRTGLEPLIISQPKGPSFHIAGTEVTWQNWHFRVGYNMRDGVVLYQIGYAQNGVVRPIIYRMSLDDVYVPYSLPDRNWVWRAALDTAEYDLGQYAEPLAVGTDVPQNAVFFNEAAAGDGGPLYSGPVALPNAVALYERDGGSLWDRTDPSTAARDARFSRELVVTSAYVIGNYTYDLEYTFRMDGGIDVRVGATGTTLTRGVTSTAQGNQYGTTVAPFISAPAHQHFFNVRIDFDVDGTNNRVLELNNSTVPSGWGNAFVTNQTSLSTEQYRDASPSTNRRWVVQSTTATNALGEPTAYELDPIDYSQPYSQANYSALQHAQFATHGLWLSLYRDGEFYATGQYPNEGPPGLGLPQYIAGQANIDNQDSVVWYTMGFTHDPTVEEYPTMTHESIGFAIRPAGFFNQNPALDAPPG